MIALYSRQWSLLDPVRLSKLVTTTSEVLVLGDRETEFRARSACRWAGTRLWTV
jgi:hypothetical protein